MMHEPQPILVAHLFQPVNDALVVLLRGLDAEEWNAPTAAGAWTVKDVAAHLLDTTLRRLSMHRDAYAPPLPPDAFANGLGAFVNGMNREGVAVLRRLSPQILIELHAHYGAQMAAFFETLDPFATAQWGVSWAGEEQSPMWFDIARELTERWHHQQQIRDAVGREPLAHREPVLETFVRALPFTYRDVEAADGTTVVLRIDDAAWTLAREGDWRLYAGAPDSPTTTVTMSGERAWKVFTKQKIDPQARVEGDARLAEPISRMVSVI
ncbi:MAG: maleylpyruvate isomerase family mycothiol-dependent enzyme [Thermoanaerobaculia bacterium]